MALHSTEDVEYVRKIVGNLSIPVWLGGYSVSQSDSWFWSDGSAFSFDVWTNHTSAKSNENEACVEMTSKDGELNSAPCGELRFYICSRKANLTFYDNNNEKAEVSLDLNPGFGLFDIIWDQSDSLAEEILHSSSFLLELKSGSITERCYAQFAQQEALYLQLVHSTLEALTAYIEEADPDVRSLLLDTKQLYKSQFEKVQSLVDFPQWLQFSLLSFHSVVLDEPVYLLVALSARSSLQSFLFQSLSLPGSVSGNETHSLYEHWRKDSEREVQLAHRFREVMYSRQKHLDVYKTMNVFRQHLMNQKSLHKAVECV